MLRNIVRFSMAALVACLAAAPAPARADIVVTIHQAASDVVVNYSGSADVTNATFAGSGQFGQNTNQALLFQPTASGLTQFRAGNYYAYASNFSGFGSGYHVFTVQGSSPTGLKYSASGDIFGFVSGQVALPSRFGSNPIGTLSGSITYLNSTFASMGITPGSHDWTLNGTSTHVFLSTSVPEPGTMLMGGLLAVGGGVAGWRRMRKSQTLVA